MAISETSVAKATVMAEAYLRERERSVTALAQVPAALFMAVTKTLFKATAGKVSSPDGILSAKPGDVPGQ